VLAVLEEIWKDIEGWEGVYQVSSKGRLKSFKSDVNGYILSNINKKGGYFSVVLTDSIHKRKRYVRMHVLVAEAFIGKRIKGMQIHHKDGNKQNNIVSNLEYIHPADHYKETLVNNPQIVTGIVNYNKYKKPNKIQQFSTDGIFIAEYCNAAEASYATGVCHRNILQVANKEQYRPGLTRKQAGGYVWRFKEVI